MHVHDDVSVHNLEKLESKTSQNYAKSSDNARPKHSNFLRTVAVFGSPNYHHPIISKPGDCAPELVAHLPILQ